MSVHHYERQKNRFQCKRCGDTIPIPKEKGRRNDLVATVEMIKAKMKEAERRA